MSIFIGIDNGLKGGIATLKEGKLFLNVMPVVSDGKKNRVDAGAFRKVIHGYCELEVNYFIVYERPGGSKSKNAAVSMADSFARIETVLIIDNCPREPITAQKWQKMFWKKPKMPKGKKFDTKAAALKVAKELRPEQNWLASDKCRKPHDGLVDAFLLATYCQRTHGV